MSSQGCAEEEGRPGPTPVGSLRAEFEKFWLRRYPTHRAEWSCAATPMAAGVLRAARAARTIPVHRPSLGAATTADSPPHVRTVTQGTPNPSSWDGTCSMPVVCQSCVSRLSVACQSCVSCVSVVCQACVSRVSVVCQLCDSGAQGRRGISVASVASVLAVMAICSLPAAALRGSGGMRSASWPHGPPWGGSWYCSTACSHPGGNGAAWARRPCCTPWCELDESDHTENRR
jgi:hypothetical protein